MEDEIGCAFVHLLTLIKSKSKVNGEIIYYKSPTLCIFSRAEYNSI